MKPLWAAPIVPYPQLKQVLQGSAEADAGRRWLAESWGRGCWAGQLGSPRPQAFPEGTESGTPGCGDLWPGPLSQYLSLKDQLTGCQDLALFLPKLFHKGVPLHEGQHPVLDIQPDHWGPHAPSPQALLALEGGGVHRNEGQVGRFWLLPSLGKELILLTFKSTQHLACQAHIFSLKIKTHQPLPRPVRLTPESRCHSSNTTSGGLSLVSWGFSYSRRCWKMSVWAHVGATESLRVCVHWLWFRKTNRTKGPGGGR